MTSPFRIGTRGSPLALVQARLVADRIRAVSPESAIEVVPVATSGDRVQDRPLAEIGGKGLFTKEIDRALLDGRIDAAVHSAKDMETWLPDGVAIAAVPSREDPRDALITASGPSSEGYGLDALPAGATVGTGSVRRTAQILHRRPDLRVAPLRGNVGTRLDKLRSGVMDATVLALAGLRRLGLESAATAVLDPAVMLPAAGQGALAVVTRAGDSAAMELLAAVNDADSFLCLSVERAMLAALDGSCRTPIGALAILDPAIGRVRLDGLVARPDGTRLVRLDDSAPSGEACAMAGRLGRALHTEMGEDLFR